jgi:hypothetical protein
VTDPRFAIRPIATREQPFARSVVVSYGNPIARLTDREREILRTVATHGTTEALQVLCIERQTMKNRLGIAFRKLGLVGGDDRKAVRAAYLLGRWDERKATQL